MRCVSGWRQSRFEIGCIQQLRMYGHLGLQFGVKIKCMSFFLWVEIVVKENPFKELDSVQAALGVVHDNLRLKIPENAPFVLAK